MAEELPAADSPRGNLNEFHNRLFGQASNPSITLSTMTSKTTRRVLGVKSLSFSNAGQVDGFRAGTCAAQLSQSGTHVFRHCDTSPP